MARSEGSIASIDAFDLRLHTASAIAGRRFIPTRLSTGGRAPCMGGRSDGSRCNDTVAGTEEY
ncbi:hypothetical protein, partial [Pseudomonas sp. SIMBA_021]|uniref:hypothetical protein n=1 Tax=Pseudomonas sp. SIMBA_021 TaxID=3085767 RepID=UPI0039785146